MKLTRSIFMLFTIFLSVLHCSEQRPKGWKDLMSFSNPLATFQPSMISKGHAQYFGSIDHVSHEKKQDLQKFLTYLAGVKGVHALGICLISCRFQSPFNYFGFGLAVLNAYYCIELNKFKRKLAQNE